MRAKDDKDRLGKALDDIDLLKAVDQIAVTIDRKNGQLFRCRIVSVCRLFCWFVHVVNRNTTCRNVSSTKLVCVETFSIGTSMTIAERLAQLKQTHAWTKDDLARQLGVSRSAVAFYESGERSPRPKIIKNIEALERGEVFPLPGNQDVDARPPWAKEIISTNEKIIDKLANIEGMLMLLAQQRIQQPERVAGPGSGKSSLTNIPADEMGGSTERPNVQVTGAKHKVG